MFSENQNIEVGKIEIPTVKEILALIIFKLREGGKAITSDEYASKITQIAYLNIKEYLKSLPNELKEKLMNLKGDNCPPLKDLLKDLEDGGCAQIVANSLSFLLKNNLDSEILQSRPPQTEKTRAVEMFKNVNHSLILFASIRDTKERLQIIQKYLMPLTKEQRIERLKEINFHGVSLLHIAAWDDQMHIEAWDEDDKKSGPLIEMLNLIDPEKRLEVIQVKNFNKDTILHISASNDDFKLFKDILSLIPEDQRLDALNVLDRCGDTILYNTAPFSASSAVDIERFKRFNFMLNSLPENMRWQAVNEKSSHDKTMSVLDIVYRKKNINLLEDIRKALPDMYKQNIDKIIQNCTLNTLTNFETSVEGTTAAEKNISSNAQPSTQTNEADIKKSQWVMQKQAWYNLPGRVTQKLNSIPKDQVWNVVNEKDSQGFSLLERANNNKNVKILKIIQNALPDTYKKTLEKMIQDSEISTASSPSSFVKNISTDINNSSTKSGSETKTNTDYDVKSHKT